MDVPKSKWSNQPSKIIKKSNVMEINESCDPDDTDLDTVVEGRESEIEREGMMYTKKHHSFNLGKSHIKTSIEEMNCEDSCSCDSMEPPAPPTKCKPKNICPPKISMCGKMPEKMLLAHAYVPWQHYQKAFTPDEALKKGTLFPELWGVYPIPR